MPANTELRPGCPEDVPVILALITELAEYERLPHEVVATEAILKETLFGPKNYAETILAFSDGEPVGFALFFHSYSTFLGRPGIYLEDLFVRPHAEARASAEGSWPKSPNWPWTDSAAGLNGRCLNGTSRLSSSMRSSALGINPIGP